MKFLEIMFTQDKNRKIIIFPIDVPLLIYIFHRLFFVTSN